MAELATLFATSFVAATLVPLPSEAALFAWLPIIGDAISVAAGWLRMNSIAVLAFMAAGRFARYLAVAALSS